MALQRRRHAIRNANPVRLPIVHLLRPVASLLVPVALWLLIAAPAFATTYIIRPDGGGDFPTIQAGLNASTSGDVIMLTDGVFTGPGNRNLEMMDHAGLICSLSGYATGCVIDLEGEPLGSVGAGGEFRNIGIRNGRALSGYMCVIRFVGCRFTNAIRVASAQEGTLMLTDCTLTGGQGSAYYGDGTTVHLVRCHMSGNAGAGTFTGFHVTAQDCVFENNTTGAVLGVFPYMNMAGALEATRCRFAGNVASQGALSSFGGDVTAEACTFSDNTGPSLQVTMGYYDLTILVTGCTMSDNHGSSEILLLPYPFARLVPTLNLDHSIIAFREPGCAVVCSDVVPVTNVACCDIFGNAGGDWVGWIAEHAGIDGNIAEDPLFCGGDDACDLRSDSPCAPGAACPELIGANPVGCAPASAPDAAGPGMPFDAPFVVAQPNPGVDRVTFHGDAAAGPWTLDLFDATGRRVRSLAAGTGTGLVWDGRDASGAPLPAGLYLYLARSAGREQRGSLILAR